MSAVAQKTRMQTNRALRCRTLQASVAYAVPEGLALEEAYRLVTVREGNKVMRLPAIQAMKDGVAEGTDCGISS
jgi:hypothetical protein